MVSRLASSGTVCVCVCVCMCACNRFRKEGLGMRQAPTQHGYEAGPMSGLEHGSQFSLASM